MWLDGYFIEVKHLFIFLVKVPSSVEKVVGRIRAYSALQIRFRNLRHARVVKLIPVLSCRIFTKSGVVTEAHVSKVVRHGIKVIDKRLVGLVLSNNMLGQIKAIQGKLHVGINLLAEVTSSATEHTVVPTAGLTSLLESLEVYDEDWRRPVYL